MPFKAESNPTLQSQSIFFTSRKPCRGVGNRFSTIEAASAIFAARLRVRLSGGCEAACVMSKVDEGRPASRGVSVLRLLSVLEARAAALVHASAAASQTTELRHRVFIRHKLVIACVAVGLMPLYLAAEGAPFALGRPASRRPSSAVGGARDRLAHGPAAPRASGLRGRAHLARDYPGARRLAGRPRCAAVASGPAVRGGRRLRGDHGNRCRPCRHRGLGGGPGRRPSGRRSGAGPSLRLSGARLRDLFGARRRHHAAAAARLETARRRRTPRLDRNGGRPSAPRRPGRPRHGADRLRRPHARPDARPI